MIARLLSALILALALAGCATPTPYRAAGTGRGYGYSEQLLERNRFRVAFRATAMTPRATAENYALLRAAELTLAQGGDYFVVTRRDMTYEGGDDDGAVGAGIGGGSRGMGGGIGIDVPIGMSGPRSRTAVLEIVIHRGPKPAGQPDTYDARAVRQALAPRG